MHGNIYETGSDSRKQQVLRELDSTIQDLALYLEKNSGALKALLADARNLVAEVQSVQANNVYRITAKFEELITRYDNLTEALDRDQRQPIALPVSLTEDQIQEIKTSIVKELNERIRYLAFIFEQKTLKKLERCLQDARSLKESIQKEGITDSYERKVRELNSKIDRVFRPLEKNDE